jgi:nucleoside 2-deoxyribosyltransferase|tara:strand:+ start:969 stop:1394 length:426 start_codon:yes stop_codon:yes gene_type:complete
MIKRIYIAGPLFNIHETRFLEDIAKELESNGYQCFLPHRDQSGINESELEKTEMSEATKDRIFNNDLDALKGADITVALITGWDIDSGTAGEIGYTFACGKPIVAIDASERRYRNLFVEGMITKTVNDVDEIIPAIEKIMA